jgi:hypothetical protein
MFVEQRWLTIPADALEHRALGGDTGETKGGHWCGAEATELAMLVTYCAFLPPNLASAR